LPALQHVLSHCVDVRTVSTARLVSKAWHSAVSGAAAAVECSLPGNDSPAHKLQRLHTVAPCLTQLRLNIGPGAGSELLVDALANVACFVFVR
jgi:hypothetical protein